MKIGYSLSSCVLEILQGKVALEEVIKIHANTLMRTEEEWQIVINQYGRNISLWGKFPCEEVTRVIKYLRDNNLIDQHRLLDDSHPDNIALRATRERIGYSTTWEEVPSWGKDPNTIQV